MNDIRVGQGFDVHALVDGRPLVIGGVTIPFARGLQGHSDADVLLHAITDALLGAAGLGDIGHHFPDTNAQWKDADSRMLLRAAMGKVASAGWKVVNVDCTVIAEAPKIAPHATEMCRNIAGDLGITVDRINVKGKTAEKLGVIGRNEGIAAQAVVLLQR